MKMLRLSLSTRDHYLSWRPARVEPNQELETLLIFAEMLLEGPQGPRVQLQGGGLS